MTPNPQMGVEVTFVYCMPLAPKGELELLLSFIFFSLFNSALNCYK